LKYLSFKRNNYICNTNQQTLNHNECMRSSVILLLISLVTFSLNAQNNVVVTVTTSKINNETYITTTITNKNAEIILIPVKGFADDYCNVFNGGPSYITLNAYDESHLTASSAIIPIYQENSSVYIKLLPYQSYKRRSRLYSFYNYEGFFDNPLGGSLKYIEAKVHLVYIYFCNSNPTTFTADFVSAKVTY